MSIKRIAYLTITISAVLLVCSCGFFSGSTSSPYFAVQSEYYSNGVNYVEPSVLVSGFYGGGTPPGSNWVTAFGPLSTAGSGRISIENVYVPAYWAFTRYQSTHCPASVNSNQYMQNTAIAHLSCNSNVAAFNVSPSSVAAFAPPATVSISGSGISSQYGMPRVDFYDDNGNILASPSAQSVAGDGSSLVVSLPSLTNQYSGEYAAVVSNVNSDSSVSAIGTAGLIVTIGSVTIDGWGQVAEIDGCPDTIYSPCWTDVDDTGIVYVTVNGYTASYNYNGADSSGSIATGLANAFNGDPAAPVSAAVRGSVLVFASKGPIGSYPLSTEVDWDSQHFSSASYTATASGSTL